MSDVQPVNSQNNNKTLASVAGGLSGTALGAGIVALITLKYPALNQVIASTIGSLAAAALASVGAWLAPILTAAQHRAIIALDGRATPDQKVILTVDKAQAIVSAAAGAVPKSQTMSS